MGLHETLIALCTVRDGPDHVSQGRHVVFPVVEPTRHPCLRFRIPSQLRRSQPDDQLRRDLMLNRKQSDLVVVGISDAANQKLELVFVVRTRHCEGRIVN